MKICDNKNFNDTYVFPFDYIVTVFFYKALLFLFEFFNRVFCPPKLARVSIFIEQTAYS